MITGRSAISDQRTVVTRVLNAERAMPWFAAPTKLLVILRTSDKDVRRISTLTSPTARNRSTYVHMGAGRFAGDYPREASHA
jgi:hypothetical protein